MPFSLGNMFASMPAAYAGAQQVQEQPYHMQALQDEQQARQQSLELNRMKLQSLADSSAQAKEEQTRFSDLMKDDSFVGSDGKPMSSEVKSLAAARQAAIDAKDPDKVLSIDAARDNAEYKAAIGAKMKAEALQTRTEQGVQDANAILQADGDPAVVDDVLKNAVEQGRVPPEKAAELRGMIKLGLDGRLTPQSRALLTSRVTAATKVIDQIKTQKDAADRSLRERETKARELDAQTRQQAEVRREAGGKEGDAKKSKDFYIQQRQVQAGNLALGAVETFNEFASGTTTGILSSMTTKDGMTNAVRNKFVRGMAPTEQRQMQTMFKGLGRNLATIEASGMAQGLTTIAKQMEDGVYITAGDDAYSTAMKMAEIRRIVEHGIDTNIRSGVFSGDQKEEAQRIVDGFKKAIPYTTIDVARASRKEGAKTLGETSEEKVVGKKGGFDLSKLSPDQQSALPQIKRLIAAGKIEDAKAIASEAGITLK